MFSPCRRESRHTGRRLMNSLYGDTKMTYELGAGYEDGAEMCLSNKSREQLEALLMDSMASEEANTDYEKGFRSAIKDYIKEKWENE